MSDKMTSENYVENAVRTDCIYDTKLAVRLVDSARLLHAAIGMVTESAELIDMLKKHIYYSKPLDLVNAAEEVGDSAWYIGLAIDEMKTTMNEVLTLNIDKLKLRYPNKFNSEDAINRNVAAERVLLEKDSLNRTFVTPATLSSEAKEFAVGMAQQKSGNPKKSDYLTGNGVEYKACEFVSVEPHTPVQHMNFSVTHFNPVRKLEYIMVDGVKFEEVPDVVASCSNSHAANSNRGKEFVSFANDVLAHIEGYTVPQYGDKGSDQATDWTVEHCIEEAKKYLNRFGKNQRPGQEELDFKKASHYVQLAATKFNARKNENILSEVARKAVAEPVKPKKW